MNQFDFFQDDIAPKLFVPTGARLVEAWEFDGELIVTGCPSCDDDSHNCDEMGCTSVSHVILRAPIPSGATLAGASRAYIE